MSGRPIYADTLQEIRASLEGSSFSVDFIESAHAEKWVSGALRALAERVHGTPLLVASAEYNDACATLHVLTEDRAHTLSAVGKLRTDGTGPAEVALHLTEVSTSRITALDTEITILGGSFGNDTEPHIESLTATTESGHTFTFTRPRYGRYRDALTGATEKLRARLE